MKSRSRFRVNLSILAASIGSLLVGASAFAADEALIAAAKKEGELTWYTTQIINQFGPAQLVANGEPCPCAGVLGAVRARARAPTQTRARARHHAMA
jgi:hypothetical protein